MFARNEAAAEGPSQNVTECFNIIVPKKQSETLALFLPIVLQEGLQTLDFNTMTQAEL